MLARRNARGRGRVRVIVVDEHGLGESVIALVAEGEQHPPAPTRRPDLARASGQHQHRRAPPLPTDLQLAPADAQAEPGPQRLQPGFLGGEPSGEVLHRIPPRAAVGDLALGEDSLQEALVPAGDDLAHPPDTDDVDPDAADRHRSYGSPMSPRITAARSFATSWTRPTSLPSTITRASDSVPEYRMRTRPLAPISASTARTRSVRRPSDSRGGFCFTGTLTSTWGNFRMQPARVPRDSPVSRMTESKARAERMPSPAGENSV